MKRGTLIALIAVTLVLLMSFWSAALAGPQPLPESACNQGTANANTHAQDGDTVAHHHDFDGDGQEACYHFNPTYPPPGPGDE